MTGIAVNIAVIQNDRILLTQHEDFETWLLPSGSVEEDETVAQAAIREIKVETGLEVELTGLVGIYSRTGTVPGVQAILFTARPIGGEIKCPQGKTLAVEWFDFDKIPAPLSPGHQKRIEDAIAGVRGVIVQQEIILPEFALYKLSRQDLLELRDKSDLPRQAFWLQLFKNAIITNKTEVG